MRDSPAKRRPHRKVGRPGLLRRVRAARGRGRSLELSYVLAIVAAVVLVVMVNILSARHYRRWDWTSGGLYTLSPLTTHTLRSLGEPVRLYVLLSGADPLTITLRHLAEAYQAETRHLTFEFVDPDRRPAEFLAIQRRYGIAVGKTEDGRIVSDAAIIVARGERHHFITGGELVEVDDPGDMRARPRLEQALTGGLRQVTVGEPLTVCFTTGHGEDSILQAGPHGLASLADRLTKQNYRVVELEPVSRIEGEDPIATCRLLVVAGPKRRFGPADVNRLRSYLDDGGNGLFALGPVPDAVAETYLDVGLKPVLRSANVLLRDDFVFELDPLQRSSQGFGEAFLASAKPHAITEGLLAAEEHDFAVFLEVVRSLSSREGDSVVPVPLLVTSKEAFGMADFFAWARDPSPPEAGDADHPGPLVVAYAVELPQGRGESPQGPRVVIVGSASPLQNSNWQQEELRGTALFVESAISWLAAEPIVLDIPNKPARAVGLRMTEEALGSVLRYALLYIPFGAALLGVAVALRRRSSEGRSRRKTRRPSGSPADRGGDAGQSGRRSSDPTPPRKPAAPPEETE